MTTTATKKDEPSLQESLVRIQQELKAPKGQYNSFGKYKYRSAEDILEAVKPLLGKYGCILTLSDDISECQDRIYIKATAIIRKKDAQIQTTAFAREPLTKKGMDDSQVTGTASSYARKYALNGMFCIDDAKDADTDEYHNQQGNAQKQPARQVSRKDNPQWQAFYNRVAQAASKANSMDEVTKLYNSYINDPANKLFDLASDENFKAIFNGRFKQLKQ